MLLSIITIGLNNAHGMEKTIRSVISQTSSDIEYIVIDGGSTDGSVDIIRKHTDDIDFWVSEPDTGIYNAMNKGILKAHGDYCLFLNSGDWLIDSQVIAGVLEQIDGSTDIYYADARYAKDDGRKVKTIRYPAHVDINFFISSTINHQNTFIRRSLFDRLGLYDESFRIIADGFFLLRACKEHITFKKIETFVSCCIPNGISEDPAFSEKRDRERERVAEIVFGELAPSINALREFQTSVYANTLSHLRNPGFYFFCLRVFRFLTVRIYDIMKKGNNGE